MAKNKELPSHDSEGNQTDGDNLPKRFLKALGASIGAGTAAGVATVGGMALDKGLSPSETHRLIEEISRLEGMKAPTQYRDPRNSGWKPLRPLKDKAAIRASRLSNKGNLGTLLSNLTSFYSPEDHKVFLPSKKPLQSVVAHELGHASSKGRGLFNDLRKANLKHLYPRSKLWSGLPTWALLSEKEEVRDLAAPVSLALASPVLAEEAIASGKALKNLYKLRGAKAALRGAPGLAGAFATYASVPGGVWLGNKWITGKNKAAKTQKDEESLRMSKAASATFEGGLAEQWIHADFNKFAKASWQKAWGGLSNAAKNRLRDYAGSGVKNLPKMREGMFMPGHSPTKLRAQNKADQLIYDQARKHRPDILRLNSKAGPYAARYDSKNTVIALPKNPAAGRMTRATSRPDLRGAEGTHNRAILEHENSEGVMEFAKGKNNARGKWARSQKAIRENGAVVHSSAHPLIAEANISGKNPKSLHDMRTGWGETAAQGKMYGVLKNHGWTPVNGLPLYGRASAKVQGKAEKIFSASGAQYLANQRRGLKSHFRGKRLVKELRDARRASREYAGSKGVLNE